MKSVIIIQSFDVRSHKPHTAGKFCSEVLIYMTEENTFILLSPRNFLFNFGYLLQNTHFSCSSGQRPGSPNFSRMGNHEQISFSNFRDCRGTCTFLTGFYCGELKSARAARNLNHPSVFVSLFVCCCRQSATTLYTEQKYYSHFVCCHKVKI